jgi:Holliday junction resolvasome RuvABC endonuclease subunit
MVYIEDKFVGKNKKQVLYDGGLLYHIVIETYKHFLPYKVINPTTLKSFVIGTKGKKKGSKKELMLLHCFKKWGEEFENNNLCDAYCLARMALEDMLIKQKSTGNVKRVKR